MKLKNEELGVKWGESDPAAMLGVVLLIVGIWLAGACLMWFIIGGF